MNTPEKYLVVVCGPTASGKTAAAIDLAQHYETDILSCDSRQVYREMNIGTAKPSLDELLEARHHFISSISIGKEYSAGQFERDALALLIELYKHKEIVIAAGGTGLYFKALTEGFDDIPAVDPKIRESVILEFEEQGLEHLQQVAMKADPEGYAVTDVNNPQRLMRLVEVYRSTGQPKSSFTARQSNIERPFTTIWIGLDVDRQQLYGRINQRVDEMMAKGLLEEVRSLLPYRESVALQTVGYSELFEHLVGNSTLETAVDLIKRNSRRYAKRQLTWFRKNSDIKWFDPSDTDGMTSYIDETRIASA